MSEHEDGVTVLPPFPIGPLVVGEKARMAKMPLDRIPVDRPRERPIDEIGTVYTTGRDLALEEFVILHVGCGRKQRLDQLPPITTYDASGKAVAPPIRLINLDGMAHAGAHLTATLGEDRIPLPDSSVDLLVATHVLEHIGRQGELGAWFQFWGEAYRVLKAGGRVSFLSPYYTSVWCWGDPTHSRAISEYAFLYLNQDSYRIPAEQTAIPDYRPPCDFQLTHWQLVEDANPDVRRKEARSHMTGTLVARKPFRPYWKD